MLRAAIGVLLVALTSAANAQSFTCGSDQKPMLTAELLFGRNIEGRLGVTERRWSKFLANEITPRFPDGLTAIDASGQWRDQAGGKLVRERSKLVIIVMPDGAEARSRIAAIVAEYKRRFRQQSVGVLIRPVCASF